jgi:hypothetical protein
MQVGSLSHFSILVFTFCLFLAIFITSYDSISPNGTTYSDESYATSVSVNSSSEEADNSTISNNENLFGRIDDGFFSEYNITGNNNSLPSQSSLLEGDNSDISNETQLDGLSSNNVTSSSSYLNTTGTETGPYPGTLQIPYTGLARYHMTPAISKLFGLNETTYAMLVTRVEPGSPAAEAGIRSGNVTTNLLGDVVKVGGDIILGVDSNSSLVRNNDAFVNYLQNEKRVGENVTLNILRDGQINDVELTIGAVPRFLWYENIDEGIRMKYPSDWRADESDLSKQDIVKFFSPETTDVSNSTLPIAGSFVKVTPTASSLDDVASVQQEGTANTRTLDMFLTNVSNLPGYEIVFYDYSDRDRTLKILSVFTIKDGQMYRINFAVDPPKYDDYLPLAREMIESFQFTK